jgi:hypothetical protein
MSKTSVSKSVSLMIVTIILLSSIILAGCSPIKPTDGGIYITWNYSYVLSSCDLPPLEPFGSFPMLWYSQPDEFKGASDTTVGQIIDELLSLNNPESEFTCPSMPNDIVLYMSDSKGTHVIPNDSTLTFLADATENTLLFFGPSHKSKEFVRLTLFGYVTDGNSSCVLWSLDGTPNLRANEKCGGEVELVCTVKLVEKNLKYNCKDGYDWLGFNIIHDSHWLSWADQFASKNGNK